MLNCRAKKHELIMGNWCHMILIRVSPPRRLNIWSNWTLNCIKLWITSYHEFNECLNLQFTWHLAALSHFSIKFTEFNHFVIIWTPLLVVLRKNFLLILLIITPSPKRILIMKVIVTHQFELITWNNPIYSDLLGKLTPKQNDFAIRMRSYRQYYSYVYWCETFFFCFCFSMQKYCYGR